MPKSCLPFHLFPSVIARVDGRPDIFIFGIGTDFLVQRWNFRLGFGPTTQASRVHFWWHWKWRKQKQGIKGYLVLFYHLSWSRTCTHATSALFLWHCVWKSLIKSHFTTLRAKRATIIFKYIWILKWDIFGDFQTLWCAIFGIVTKQSDKNWLDGVLKYTILGLLLAILAGAHLKWYLEPNSSIQEFKKEMKYYFIPVGTSFKLKLNSILGATWSYCGVVKTDALWTLDMVHWSRRTTVLLTASN